VSRRRGPVLLDTELVKGPQAPGAARRLVARLAPELSGELVTRIVLLVSEVVTNSYRYGGSGDETIGLRVGLRDGGVRVEVSDAGTGPTTPAIREGSIDGGWGLRIVEELSSRWGVKTRPKRTIVWFELEMSGVGSHPGTGG
jgi:anti-sigma regulatory factor (Ser/Thr protein kinase)